MEFKHTAHVTTVHSMHVGMADLIEIVGDPDNASYEWVISCNGVVEQHSDDGYGSPEAALRDALIDRLGLPTSVIHQVAELQTEIQQLAADRGKLVAALLTYDAADLASLRAAVIPDEQADDSQIETTNPQHERVNSCAAIDDVGAI